jgi:hypothetical protein
VPENNVEAVAAPQNTQYKVDTNTVQQKVDPNVNQQQETGNVSEDPNFKAFREARKRDREIRQEAEKRAAEKEAEAAALRAAMEAAFSKSPIPQSATNQYNNSDYAQEETEDERIEKKVAAAIAMREAQAEKARQEREHQEYPQRLNQSYNDFNQTISQENLDYLDYHYPEVSRPLQRLPEGYDKWSDIYKAVKKFVPNNMTAKKEAAKADANFNKPKSMSSTGMTQTGEVVGGARLTEEKRAENWARMQKILKGVS